jgi:hypothetical protein
MDNTTWDCLPADIKDTIIRTCFTDDNVVMTDETFLNMMRFAREQAPDLHKMVVEAIDPYLSIEKECCDSIDWEEFLKKKTVASIMNFLQEYKIDVTLSSEEKRSKKKLIERVAYALKRDPATLLRQKRVDGIKRNISFSKNFVPNERAEEGFRIARNILLDVHRQHGFSGKDDETSLNNSIDMLFGKVPLTSLHPYLLQMK